MIRICSCRTLLYLALVRPTMAHACLYTRPGVRNRWKSIIGKLINQSISIDINRYQLVNWYWLVLVNRWLIDSHIKLSANYIDFHQLAMLIWLLFCLKVTESSFIDCSSISNIYRLIVIDWYQLASILTDWQFHRLRTPSCIEHFHVTSLPPCWRAKKKHFLSPGK